jgi:hypothetical protein
MAVIERRDKTRALRDSLVKCKRGCRVEGQKSEFARSRDLEQEGMKRMSGTPAESVKKLVSWNLVGK